MFEIIPIYQAQVRSLFSRMARSGPDQSALDGKHIRRIADRVCYASLNVY